MYKLRICSHSSVSPGPLVPGMSRYDLIPEGGFHTWEMDSSAGYLIDDFSAYDVDFSPDNFVQDATNTQAYNRYSYALNNPLKYTDPSGEWVHLVVGAVVGGTMNWIVNGADFSWQGLGSFDIGTPSAGGELVVLYSSRSFIVARHFYGVRYEANLSGGSGIFYGGATGTFAWHDNDHSGFTIGIGVSAGLSMNLWPGWISGDINKGYTGRSWKEVLSGINNNLMYDW